ncbi:MAG: HEAT repeat domain-containing protein [Verrucomicrobiales bacterium]|nr:HEAT repeat domain-containing protein [Verrucomicrobiales bacterium]
MQFPPFSRILPILLFATASTLEAQNGLRDIPDPGVEAQLKAFRLIEGAKINLFASEPAVTSPTNMNWDQQGRLWVVSSPLYPHIQPGQNEEDKLVILEDTDGDGVADKHTDFATNLHIPTAVLPGDGGVYVANSTEVLFLRDTNGDNVADERKVILSGFGTEDTHHLLHTFRWGPEGMIWMNQSIYIHTHLETPYGIRRLLGGGMWHYRPETRRAEVFMKGLVNPWGHAFDEWGQSFMTDGAGSEGINFVFPRSVFATSPGASRILPGLNPGQPKHCSLEVLTGRHIPDSLRGTLAAPDFRGNRINLFQLTDKGSAYTSTQVDDLVSSTHRAFRPIDVKMGPDGAIYVADWYNPIIQHGEVDFRDPRRDHSHGRIWRITFEGRDLVKAPDLKNASEADLIQHTNAVEGWTRTAAMVELRNRKPEAVLAAIQGASAPAGVDPDLVSLRKVWATQAVNQFDAAGAAALLSSPNPKIRAGALRAIYYSAAENPEALTLAEKAVSDPHPQVRLWAVCVLAQLLSPDTVKIALRALENIEVDQFLDFAIWSICREHAPRWTAAAETGNPFANTRQLLFAVRALNEAVAIPQILSSLKSGELSGDTEVAGVADWISKVGSADDLDALFAFALRENATPSQQITILDALASAGALRKLQPSGDSARLTRFLTSENLSIFSSAAKLAGLWKLESAREALKSAFLASATNEAKGRAALDGLISLGGPVTATLLDGLAVDPAASFLIRSLAVIGRTRMNPKEGAKLAVAVLTEAPQGKDLHGIYDAFLANKQGPGALSAALKGVTLPQEIALAGVQKASSAATKPEGLVTALQSAGDLKAMKLALTPQEMEDMMKQVAIVGDPKAGERIYRRAALQCNVCHAIGESGGLIGPNLISIGSSAPVDYLVESLLEPSKKIKEGYHTTLVTMKNGDSFAGAIAREDANELVIRDAVGHENRLAKSEIASNSISPVSLMPPGLTASLREDEFVNLVRFLSELGKEGALKTPSNRFVRQWQMMMPHDSTRDSIGFYGSAIFVSADVDYQWAPLYATVAGALPISEMPEVVGRGKNRLGVARTFLDVPVAGTIRLRLTGKLNDLDFFQGDKEIPLPETGDSVELELSVTKPGRQKLTLVGLKSFGLENVSIELLDDATKTVMIEVKNF